MLQESKVTSLANQTKCQSPLAPKGAQRVFTVTELPILVS